MENILVSKCLLGAPCRYDGRSKPCRSVIALSERYNLIPVCPECEGGLPTPRVPSERVGDKVLSAEGQDVSEQYRRGAERAYGLCLSHCVTRAILKARSPSCGRGEIYDGSFSRTLIDGVGVTAEYLSVRGIKIYTEDELDLFLGED